MEIKEVYVKTRAQFGKQCIFDLTDPIMDMEILPNPSDVNQYVTRSHCHVGVQHSKQLALHEVSSTSFKEITGEPLWGSIHSALIRIASARKAHPLLPISAPDLFSPRNANTGYTGPCSETLLTS